MILTAGRVRRLFSLCLDMFLASALLTTLQTAAGNQQPPTISNNNTLPLYNHITAANHPQQHLTSQRFRFIVNDTYAKVLPCLLPRLPPDSAEYFHFPHKDAEYHFEELKNKTAVFRQSPVHDYTGYRGPWIENIFIQHFLNKPLQHFRGLIPLFIPWVDTEIAHEYKVDNMLDVLRPLIRPNVIYFALSQSDKGLSQIGEHFPNILVFSAGGFGHGNHHPFSLDLP